MVGNDSRAKSEVEAAGACSPAAPSDTNTGCGNEGSDTPPKPVAARSAGCGGCAPPAGGPASALRQAWKGVGAAVVLLLTLRALKTAAARSRAG